MPAGSEPYLLEFIHMGGSVKVTAVDPNTGTEVSIVGPAAASQDMLSRNAIRKLEFVLEKKRNGR